MNFAKLAGIQESIATDVWPSGAILRCTHPLCAHERFATSAECGSYLRSGWPKHCDRTMSIAPQPDTPL
jgi:hypothetical protein